MKRLYLKMKNGELLQIDEKIVRASVKGGLIFRLSTDKDVGVLKKNLSNFHIEQRPRFRYGANVVLQASSAEDDDSLEKNNYSIAGEKSAAAAQQDAKNLIKAVGRDVSEAEANFYKRFSFEK